MGSYCARDVQFSSWLILTGTTLYVGIWAYIIYVIDTSSTSEFVLTENFFFFTGGLFYWLGAVVLASSSFNFAKTRAEIKNADIGRMTCVERYFNGNSLLVAAWCFTAPTLLYIVLASWAFILGLITQTEVIEYIMVLLVIFTATMVWVYACFPENLVANNKKGTTVVFDTLCCVKRPTNSFFCFGKEITTEARSDYVIGVWIIFILTAILFVVSIISLVIDPLTPNAVLFFASIAFIFFGFYVKANTSYSPEMQSTTVWDTLTFSKTELPSDELQTLI